MELVGTGRSLPARSVTSAELDARHGYPAGHVERVTGVATRHVCENEDQVGLAVAAARRALDGAGLAAGEIDLIVCASAVPYQPIPATAPAVQRALGVADGTCFATDLNCTCLGFPAAVQVVDALLRAGAYRTALVVSSEIASRALPWPGQPHVAGLFGDGAGAAVFRATGSSCVVAADFRTHASAYDACTLAAGGTRFDLREEADAFAAHSLFTMDGRELFRVTARHFGGFVDDLLERARTPRGAIARVIAHQASPGALSHLVRLCGFEREQVVDIASRVGNQVAASIPFVLDHARESGLVRPGDRIALLGTSAGVSFGGLVLDV